MSATGFVIPCHPNIPHQDMQVTLSRVTYSLEFRWNDREGSWYFYLRTEAGEDIFVGRKVVVEVPIGGRSVHPKRPPGWFIAYDTTRRGMNPGLAELGDRVQFMYLEPQES